MKKSTLKNHGWQILQFFFPQYNENLFIRWTQWTRQAWGYYQIYKLLSAVHWVQRIKRFSLYCGQKNCKICHPWFISVDFFIEFHWIKSFQFFVLSTDQCRLGNGRKDWDGQGMYWINTRKQTVFDKTHRNDILCSVLPNRKN